MQGVGRWVGHPLAPHHVAVGAVRVVPTDAGVGRVARPEVDEAPIGGRRDGRSRIDRGVPGDPDPVDARSRLGRCLVVPGDPARLARAHGCRRRSTGPCGRHRAVGEVEGVEVSLTVADLDRRAGLVEGDFGGGGFGHATGRVVEIVQPHLLQGERGRRRGAFAEGRGAERDEPGDDDDCGDGAEDMLQGRVQAPPAGNAPSLTPEDRPHVPRPLISTRPAIPGNGTATGSFTTGRSGVAAVDAATGPRGFPPPGEFRPPKRIALRGRGSAPPPYSFDAPGVSVQPG